MGSFTADFVARQSLAGFRHSCPFDSETGVFQISPASWISRDLQRTGDVWPVRAKSVPGGKYAA